MRVILVKFGLFMLCLMENFVLLNRLLYVSIVALLELMMLLLSGIYEVLSVIFFFGVYDDVILCEVCFWFEIVVLECDLLLLMSELLLWV